MKSVGIRKGARNYIIDIIFKTQENQRFSVIEIGMNNEFKIKGLFQINFEFGRFFYLVKHDRTMVLPDIGNV
ncbi:Uncharacterised protein [Chryseobacterium gleum]|uniref:Uncharacterized protein n=1 Tax=Chryseobacterium gleum TaxID=250 RepID=A0A448AWA3_CHRGE|nr:Uncharacterised protein [Chryseobacterium gleum]